MSRPTKFEEFRYLGDKRRLVVHDLDHAGDDCNIDELMASEQFSAFAPDTVPEARNRGYRPCRCIRDLERRADREAEAAELAS